MIGRQSARIAIDARLALIAAVIIAVGALIGAFAGQYLFGLDPCVLCVWQRIPYAVTALVAVLALSLPLGRRGRAFAVLGLAVIFAAGAALGAYHVGVEEHWWGSIAACSGEELQTLSFEDMASGRTPWKPCDEVDWRLLGVSLAGYNAILSGGLAVAFAAIGRTLIRRERA